MLWLSGAVINQTFISGGVDMHACMLICWSFPCKCFDLRVKFSQLFSSTKWFYQQNFPNLCMVGVPIPKSLCSWWSLSIGQNLSSTSSGWFCATPRPAFLREIWFSDCSCTSYHDTNAPLVWSMYNHAGSRMFLIAQSSVCEALNHLIYSSSKHARWNQKLPSCTSQL